LTAAEVGPSRSQLYSLLGAMLVFWSANFIFAKLAVRELPPILVVCFRTLLSGLFMLPVYSFAKDRVEHGVRRWTRADMPVLIACGVLGVVGNQLLFVVGLSMTSVAHGSVITAMGPMFVLLGASLFGHERLTARKLGGMIVAASGVAVLQIGRSATGGATFAGDLIMICSTAVFAAFSVLGKRIAAEFGSLTLNSFAFIAGAILLLPLTIWDSFRYDLTRVSAAAWTGVFYMALFPSIAGYLIYSYALRYLPASRVSSVSYLQPVLATLVAILFLHELPAPSFAGGAALVLGGVYFTERR
jgi:drug/metabolite transporter (DMT)-like permease